MRAIESELSIAPFVQEFVLGEVVLVHCESLARMDPIFGISAPELTSISESDILRIEDTEDAVEMTEESGDERIEETEEETEEDMVKVDGEDEQSDA